MTQTTTRRRFGLVRPTQRQSTLEELRRLLPPEIEPVAVSGNINAGTVEEFRAALDFFEESAAALAAQDVELIHFAGTPPFNLLGPDEERRMTERLERALGLPVFTASMNHANAFRALGVNRLVGVSYSALQCEIVTDYMTAAGFEMLEMALHSVPFAAAGDIAPDDITALARRTFEQHPEAEGVYLHGGAWRALDLVAPLERALGVPVVCVSAALAWELGQRFGIRTPRPGLGRLLAELP